MRLHAGCQIAPNKPCQIAANLTARAWMTRREIGFCPVLRNVRTAFGAMRTTLPSETSMGPACAHTKCVPLMTFGSFIAWRPFPIKNLVTRSRREAASEGQEQPWRALDADRSPQEGPEQAALPGEEPQPGRTVGDDM